MKAKKQIKNLENRIEKIEKELERNSSFTLSKDVLRGLTEPKQPVEEKPFVLPEKWCVALTKENIETLSIWRGDDALKVGDIYGYLQGNYIWADRVRQGYTEITFEQFLEHVLKASTETKPVESDTLKLEDVQVNVSDCLEEEIKYLSDIFVVNGFKLWDFINALDVEDEKKFLTVARDGEVGVIYSQDKTTLTPSQFREMFGKKEIDWSKEQYVKNKHNAIWYTTGNHSGGFFEGYLIRLADKNDNPNAKFLMKDNMVYKEGFTLCTEPITLNN